MRPLISAELARLREVYGEVEHMEVNGEDWFRIVRYPLPAGWLFDDEPRTIAPIAFLIKSDFPGGMPYGFLTQAGLSFNGAAPKNTGAAPDNVPFEGNWMLFSWDCEDWPAPNEGAQAHRLLRWAGSFQKRLSEGV